MFSKDLKVNISISISLSFALCGWETTSNVGIEEFGHNEEEVRK
jgi:hypothetical protein